MIWKIINMALIYTISVYTCGNVDENSEISSKETVPVLQFDQYFDITENHLRDVQDQIHAAIINSKTREYFHLKNDEIAHFNTISEKCGRILTLMLYNQLFFGYTGSYKFDDSSAIDPGSITEGCYGSLYLICKRKSFRHPFMILLSKSYEESQPVLERFGRDHVQCPVLFILQNRKSVSWTGDQLIDAIEKYPIASFNRYNIDMNDNFILKLSDIMANGGNHLRHIDIWGGHKILNSISKNAMHTLLASLGSAKNLVSIKLSFNQLNDLDISILAESLKRNNNVMYLQLDGNEFASERLTEMLIRPGNQISRVDTYEVYNALENENNHLRYLTVESGMFQREDAVSVLARAQLTHITFSSDDEMDIEPFCEVLTASQTIRHVNLMSKRPLAQNEMERILNALAYRKQILVRLSIEDQRDSINDNSMKHIGDMIAKGKLRNLVLKDLGLNQKSILIIEQALKNPSNILKSLDLSHNPLGHKGVKRLAAAISNCCSSIHVIHLEDVQCGVKGMESILQVYADNPKILVKLNLQQFDMEQPADEFYSRLIEIFELEGISENDHLTIQKLMKDKFGVIL